MSKHATTSSRIDQALGRTANRPAIFHATKAAGLTDLAVAVAMGIAPETMNAWTTGRRPLPPVRAAALIYVVGRLINKYGKVPALHSRYARRATTMKNTVLAWLNLARNELIEECGGYVPDEVILQSHELGKKTLEELLKGDAS